MSYDDRVEPYDVPPPRTVHPWTQVSGHQIIGRPGSKVFCKCGERPKVDDEVAPMDWGTDHLRNAWPILFERQDSESPADFVLRLSRAHTEAANVLHEIDQREGLYEGVAPGQPFPVVTDESARASDRVEVLAHQLEVLHKRRRDNEDLD